MISYNYAITGIKIRVLALVAPLALLGTALSPGTALADPALVVTSLADGGPGSLRAAITAADSAPAGTGTTISFAVAGVITLGSALPAVSRPVTIDATTAPGYVAGGAPAVEIDCAGHPGPVFAAGAAGGGLLGVAVGGAAAAGVRISARSVTVSADYIGLGRDGTPLANHGDGVLAGPGSGRDLIGRASTQGGTGAANVISGNDGSGIVLDTSSGDTIAANRIGTSPAGTAAVPNGGDGIAITGGSAGNEIGGTAFTSPDGQRNNPTGSKGQVPPVFVVPPLGNLVSGNRGNGVLVSGGSRGNVLNGNFIGTTADGDAALGNAKDGVRISHASGNSLIGCRFVNNPFVYYNVVSGNGRNGLAVVSSDNTVVQGNFFGIGADNTATVRNRLDGVLVAGTSAGTQVGGVIPLGNVAAGNGRDGIAVTGQARGFTTFNTFGGLLAFKGAAPNGRDGLLITSSGRGNLVRTNVFSGNTENGIELAGHARGVTVDPDIAGLTTTGGAALPNGGDGLLIDGRAHGNVIGGSLRSVIPQNTFSGNLGYGVAITGRAFGNRVFTSFIGTQILGVQAIGNGRGGVLVGGHAHGNLIGGTPLLPRSRRRPANLVSGNSGTGITLRPGSYADLVTGNYIGLNRRGGPLPNSGPPVRDGGRGNLVAGNRT